MMHSGRAPRPLCRLFLTLLPLCVAFPAVALDLSWPKGAEQVVQDRGPVAGFRLATGPYDGAEVPVLTLDGDLSEEVWRIPGDMSDPARLLGLLEGQLRDQGYEIGFSCADRSCGGFDFRYALPIAEGPEMHVDLGRFHYLSAARDTAEGPEHVALTISRGGLLGYVHLARVAPPGALPAPVTPSTRPVEAEPGEGLIARLTETGSAVLADVTFATGASSLPETRFESLVTLAAFLAEDPARRVVLVGHTDTEGTLDANITLSRVRARAVRAHMIEVLGANPAQIEADGIGYLAPRASNSDPDGREANRRVEVVLVGA
jgi:outer membrane protein OmpA-like peptidoglycan-associated protein